MHWLPLVAMVIASALLFPRCAVAATMDNGNDRSARSSNEEKSSDRTADTQRPRGLGAHGAPSFSHEESLPKQKQNQETQTTLAGSARTGARTPLRLQGLKAQPRYRRPGDSLEPADYKSQAGRVQEHSSLETSPKSRKSLQRGATTDLPSTGGAGFEPAEALDLDSEDDLLLMGSHPRVFFSSSSIPPKDPPLQLVLELGLLPEEDEEEDEVVEEEEEEEEEGYRGSNKAEEPDLKDARQTRDGESYRNLLLGLSAKSPTPAPLPPPLLPTERPRRAARQRRQVKHTPLERSVCESDSHWVNNRTTAIDQNKNNVTVLDKFPTKKGFRAQYFYETKCRGPDHRAARGEHGVEGGGCLGVDKKHWVSECQTKQSFVRAFTSDKDRGIGWRWILIDSSCVCVLKSRSHRSRSTA